jgi:hypothetical protein
MSFSANRCPLCRDMRYGRDAWLRQHSERVSHKDVNLNRTEYDGRRALGYSGRDHGWRSTSRDVPRIIGCRDIHQVRVLVTGAHSVPPDPEGALDRLGVRLTELETYMHRTFLSLAVGALAGFATAVHADDSAAPRSTVVLSPHGQMIVAELHGKGEVGKPCHGSASSLEIYTGTYKLDNGELVCQGPTAKVYCHPEDRAGGSGHTQCYDGNKS